MAAKLWQAMARRRIDDDTSHESGMARVMGLFDLIALGVGATLGVGVYVLGAKVASEYSGPAVTISFFMVAIVSALSAFCFAELAARVPKSGSAYVYSYVTVGEFVAFLNGWNIIFENAIGTAGVANVASTYLDYGEHVKTYLIATMPMKQYYPFLLDYPNVLAFTVILALTILLSVGVKESASLNRIFGTLNLLTIATVIITGAIYADFENWKVDPKTVEPEYQKQAGQGGFIPFGISRVIGGAAYAFFGFVGFDSIASCGGEAKNPRKNIPLAIAIALAIIFAVYFSIATVLTLMLPYYKLTAESASFPEALIQIGLPTVAKIVRVGALFALSTSLIGAMFPLPRVISTMANDGLLFKSLGKISEKTKTPVVATVISGSFIAILTSFFKFDQLLDMASISTLMTYSVISMSVLFLRYQETHDGVHIPSKPQPTLQTTFLQIFNINNQKIASKASSNIASWAILIFSFLAFVLAGILHHLLLDGAEGSALIYIFLLIIASMMVISMIAIARQPVDEFDLSFKVPFVPLLPCCAIFCNFFFMFHLTFFTWIGFGIWTAIGLSIYLIYGIRNSKEGKRS